VVLRISTSTSPPCSAGKRWSALSVVNSTASASPNTAAAIARQKSTSKPTLLPSASIEPKPGSAELTPQRSTPREITSSSRLPPSVCAAGSAAGCSTVASAGSPAGSCSAGASASCSAGCWAGTSPTADTTVPATSSGTLTSPPADAQATSSKIPVKKPKVKTAQRFLETCSNIFVSPSSGSRYE